MRTSRMNVMQYFHKTRPKPKGRWHHEVLAELPPGKEIDMRYFQRWGGIEEIYGMTLHWDGLRLRPWYRRIFIWMKIKSENFRKKT